MLRRLMVFLAILAGLAALADRGLAALAGSATADAVARSENLSSKPDVEFRGFPFLTQAVRGRFREVDVEARDLRGGDGLVVSEVRAELRGVRVGLRDALAGEVEAVPVDSGDATVTLSYADLNDYLGSRPGRLRLSPASGSARVTGSVTLPVLGTVDVVGTATPRLEGNRLVVGVTGVTATAGGSLSASGAATAALRLSFALTLTDLPFGLELTSVATTDEGIVVAARARGFVIHAR